MNVRPVVRYAARLLALMLAFLFVASGALAAGAVTVTMQPKDAYTKAGGTVTFSARAKNATGITWRLVSPDGQTVLLVKDAPNHFPGVIVSGRNSDTLTLKNVPAGMNEWQVFCTYGGQNRVETDRAVIYITNAPQATQEDVESNETGEDDIAYLYMGDEALTVRVVGAALSVNGEEQEGYLDFSDQGSIDFKVTAAERPEYWVINGARYEFDAIPRIITVRELTYPMTIEAVLKGSHSQTLLSDQQLQQKRTGAALLATSKNAEMCHITESKYGAGGWFREFDFTEDYVNRATNANEAGGQVTLRVRAIIPKEKKISYWKFNGAKLDFSSNVTEFFTFGLNETMEFQPVFEMAATTPSATQAPLPTIENLVIPLYQISCINCTFSGGSYSNTKRGFVSAGTSITVTPTTGSKGYWLSPYGDVPITSPKRNAKSIQYTVNQDVVFQWLPTDD